MSKKNNAKTTETERFMIISETLILALETLGDPLGDPRRPLRFSSQIEILFNISVLVSGGLQGDPEGRQAGL